MILGRVLLPSEGFKYYLQGIVPADLEKGFYFFVSDETFEKIVDAVDDQHCGVFTKGGKRIGGHGQCFFKKRASHDAARSIVGPFDGLVFFFFQRSQTMLAQLKVAVSVFAIFKLIDDECRFGSTVIACSAVSLKMYANNSISG